MLWQSCFPSVQVFVHRRMLQRVLLLQRFVIIFIRVLMTRFIVRPLDFSKSTLECWSPAALTLVTVVQPNNADEDGALGKVRAESAPERVPLTGLVGDTGNLQYPVPERKQNGPQTVRESISRSNFIFRVRSNAPCWSLMLKVFDHCGRSRSAGFTIVTTSEQ
jgi:hypothetical protein